jgi:hypothetical protein
MVKKFKPQANMKLELIVPNVKIKPGVKTKPLAGSALSSPEVEWRARYSVPPIYCHPDDEGWAGLSVALAKAAAKASIIVIDDNNEHYGADRSNSSKDSGAGLNWSTFDYYAGIVSERACAPMCGFGN